ncbi:MAG: hypothetical protein HC880_20050 [Bacteroidia bacterium]|nr:hypothetical protein [Bacteroidia bacterium]
MRIFRLPRPEDKRISRWSSDWWANQELSGYSPQKDNSLPQRVSPFYQMPKT